MLTLTHLDTINWRKWRLENGLTYAGVSVPPGFITDGASIPRLLWALFPPFGSYTTAAVVHDYLCFMLRQGSPLPGFENRAAIDNLFLQQMGDCGTPLIIRYFLWAGVRLWVVIRGK